MVKAQASGRIVPRAREEHLVVEVVVVEEAVVEAEEQDGLDKPTE